MDFITGGDGDPGSVRDQLRRLEARKREIAADLKVQQGDMEITIHPNLPDLYRRKVSRLQRLLDDEETRSQAVEIIRSLIDRIEVHPGQERGHCEAIIVGAPGSNPRFRAAKNNRRLLGRRRYVLDGCGACNHRELTLPPIDI
ncbi:MAG: hypothetical protein WD852_10865 [Methyloceanibacter sp.]